MTSEDASFAWNEAEKDLFAGIDASVPHSARIWNYWLGGKDNYPIDQRAGDEYMATYPGIVEIARHSRVFLNRAVTFLAGEAGIRQFLDIGTGLPTVDNTHQVAQRVAPEARIVYVDNDPLVLAHARALLTSTPEGVTTYIDADLREPKTILSTTANTLTFDEPIALMLMGIMGHIADDDQAQSIVAELLDGLPAGSYLSLYDGTNTDESFTAAQEDYDDTGAEPYRLRSPRQVARFFEGLELVEPGIVPISQWRSGPGPHDHVDAVAGVGRKP